ncbi:MAG: hypothetical protein K6G16_06245 [Lachnospiraceae bacterium]|nr:hypothetical protein [Lachnospiraceae bacterium]
MIDHHDLNNRIFALSVEDQNKVVDFVAALEAKGKAERMRKKEEAFIRFEADCSRIQAELKGKYPEGLPDQLFDYKTIVAEEAEKKYGRPD